MADSIAPATATAQALPPGTTILQVLPALGHGGVERGTLEVAAAIVAAGGRALVASDTGANVERLQRLGGEHIALNLASKNPLVMRANAGRLAELIRRERVSLVHARSRAPAWSAKWATARTGTPFVTTVHAAYTEKGRLKRRYNRVMASGDRVIAISHFIADLVRRRYATPDERLRVIHRGVDLAVFDPDAVEAGRLAALRTTWNLSPTARVVLMPARLTRLKGHAVLISAIAELLRQTPLPELVCVLVGADEGRDAYRDELQRHVRAVGLEPQRVVFASHCDDIAAAMALAAVVVSASTEPEGFGRTLAEAAAMGRPVIATAHGAAPEVLVEGETGWLVPPGQSGPMATALAAAFGLSAHERERLAAAARQRTRALFSKQVMCERTLEVYRELLSKTGS
ncbi:MAG: glycosyltransferase family 4 protein [Alphaproteobacteria bacterium]|nr:glycosyltransferase family 4 protein [Alphaproteobacteria bacterium]MCB9929545.1 glycosyltransferase family 4 protein [Alphaproteobacteria bacterium]